MGTGKVTIIFLNHYKLKATALLESCQSISSGRSKCLPYTLTIVRTSSTKWLLIFDGDFACSGSCERLAGGSVEGRPGRLINFGPQCPLEFILYRDRSAL
jgi:hypothetical protein